MYVSVLCEKVVLCDLCMLCINDMYVRCDVFCMKVCKVCMHMYVCMLCYVYVRMLCKYVRSVCMSVMSVGIV